MREAGWLLGSAFRLGPDRGFRRDTGGDFARLSGVAARSSIPPSVDAPNIYLTYTRKYDLSIIRCIFFGDFCGRQDVLQHARDNLDNNTLDG